MLASTERARHRGPRGAAAPFPGSQPRGISTAPPHTSGTVSHAQRRARQMRNAQFLLTTSTPPYASDPERETPLHHGHTNAQEQAPRGWRQAATHPGRHCWLSNPYVEKLPSGANWTTSLLNVGHSMPGRHAVAICCAAAGNRTSHGLQPTLTQNANTDSWVRGMDKHAQDTGAQLDAAPGRG
jgi:hypothetical protein